MFSAPLRTAALFACLAAGAPASAQCPGTDDAFEPNDQCTTSFSLPLGFYPGLYVEQGDPDWYAVRVSHGERLEVEALYTPPFGFGRAIGIEIRDPSISCDFVAASQLARQIDPGALGTDLGWTNLSGSVKIVAVRVYVMPDADEECYDYDLRISTQMDACAPFTDDLLEPNDACATPRPIQPGHYSGLKVALEDPDVFAVDVPAGSRLTVDVSASPALQANAIYLWEDAAHCTEYVAASSLAHSGNTGAAQSLAWLNDSALERTVLLEVRHPRFGTAPYCTDYGMLVRVAPDVCYLEDALDDNDTCATRKPLADGLYDDLRIRPDDPDFYEVRIAPGATFTAQFDFDAQLGDLNASLVDPLVHACEFDPLGMNLALAYGFTGTEVIQYTNSGATEIVATLVTVLSPIIGQPDPRCMQYDLQVTGSSVPVTPIGRAFCAPAPNQTGSPSRLSVDRVPAVHDTALTFEVDGLPPQAFGYLVMSPYADASQMVGNGHLCMGAPFFRLPDTLTAASASGGAAMTLPWGSMPVTVAPGSTWAFQHWHRDWTATGTPTTNFSSGIEVVFQL